jgi:hypothetical protein
MTRPIPSHALRARAARTQRLLAILTETLYVCARRAPTSSQESAQHAPERVPLASVAAPPRAPWSAAMQGPSLWTAHPQRVRRARRAHSAALAILQYAHGVRVGSTVRMGLQRVWRRIQPIS